MKRAANALQLRAVVSCFIGLLLMGCNVKDKWIEQMILEMGSAWVGADKAKLGQEGRDAATQRVVQKYFLPGMNKNEAFQLLHQLKANGFDVSESRHEGARNWPDGIFKPYMDGETKRNMQNQYPKGVSKFSAQKQTGRHLLIVTSHVAISFRTTDGKVEITDVDGTVWSTGI